MSQSNEKLRRGTHLCFTEFFVSKDFLNKRGGGSERHDFPSKLFLSHSTKSFPRGNHLCSRKFRLSEMFMPKRGTSSFPMENFLFPVPKNFVEEPICVSQKILCRKIS